VIPLFGLDIFEYGLDTVQMVALDHWLMLSSGILPPGVAIIRARLDQQLSVC
jgi:hypothetical protein